MITSLQNSYIKTVASLGTAKGRKKTGLFIVEGYKSIKEIDSNWDIECIIYTSGAESNEESKKLIDGYKSLWVDEKVFGHLSDTMTPQGIMAVVKQQTYEIKDLMSEKCNPFVVMMDKVQDPGNIGTIIRTADAAGATGIVMSKGCADLFSPKVVRATMGSLFHIPIMIKQDMEDMIPRLKGEGLKIYAAHLEGATYPYELPLADSVAILIGNEGSGLDKEVADKADAYVKLPMVGRSESLNASVAASILAYEVLRQRL